MEAIIGFIYEENGIEKSKEFIQKSILSSAGK
jgi:dsRNA-specific ribonuclease